MSFHHGQEIVCIFNWEKYLHKIPQEFRSSVPKQWEVYHCAGYAVLIGEDQYIYLAEFPSTCKYIESGFRPVQKTSMDTLRRLQAPTPVKVAEDA